MTTVKNPTKFELEINMKGAQTIRCEVGAIPYPTGGYLSFGAISGKWYVLNFESVIGLIAEPLEWEELDAQTGQKTGRTGKYGEEHEPAREPGR